MVIPLLAEDRARLEKQKWTLAEGIDPEKMVVGGLAQFRLGHQANGACVFLEPSGRCRIHAKFGEAAKPLACRLFPFVIHPAGQKLLVGLRFSCPSGAKNEGLPLAERAAEIPKLARLFLPDHVGDFPPPPVVTPPSLDWPDFLRFVRWLDRTLATEAPVAVKLLRCLHWLGAVERGRLDQITGEAADEILEALVAGAAEKIRAAPATAEKPSAFGRLFLRMLVLEYAQKATVADKDLRSPHRWKLLGAAWRFARSSGETPVLRAGLGRVRFSEIEKSFGGLPPASEALLTRYLRVKVQSVQFCGRPFYQRPLFEGFQNLALLYPVIIWLARWLAASAGRAELSEADVLTAVSMADHQYGFVPYLSWRTRLLQQRNDIVRLCMWYAR